MSGNETQELTSLYVYNRARGLHHDEAMSASNERIVVKYAFMTKMALMASLLLSFVIVVMTPLFSHASGMERIHAMGWIMMVSMVLSVYFPFRAKNGILWGIYVIIALLVAVLASL